MGDLILDKMNDEAMNVSTSYITKIRRYIVRKARLIGFREYQKPKKCYISPENKYIIPNVENKKTYFLLKILWINLLFF